LSAVTEVFGQESSQTTIFYFWEDFLSDTWSLLIEAYDNTFCFSAWFY